MPWRFRGDAGRQIGGRPCRSPPASRPLPMLWRSFDPACLRERHRRRPVRARPHKRPCVRCSRADAANWTAVSEPEVSFRQALLQKICKDPDLARQIRPAGIDQPCRRFKRGGGHPVTGEQVNEVPHRNRVVDKPVWKQCRSQSQTCGSKQRAGRCKRDVAGDRHATRRHPDAGGERTAGCAGRPLRRRRGRARVPRRRCANSSACWPVRSRPSHPA